EPVSAGWQARLDGARLDDRRAWGWAQAWSVPSSGGVLDVQRSGRSLPATAAVLGLLLVLAGPGGPRRRGLERL
ncbi:MAG: hypothetical protein H7323_02045, partial [Frankiales bacterium]|nr:hypothetical protein [Frankiales bacterium]